MKVYVLFIRDASSLKNNKDYLVEGIYTIEEGAVNRFKKLAKHSPFVDGYILTKSVKGMEKIYKQIYKRHV